MGNFHSWGKSYEAYTFDKKASWYSQKLLSCVHFKLYFNVHYCYSFKSLMLTKALQYIQ